MGASTQQSYDCTAHLETMSQTLSDGVGLKESRSGKLALQHAYCHTEHRWIRPCLSVLVLSSSRRTNFVHQSRSGYTTQLAIRLLPSSCISARLKCNFSP